MPAQPPPPASGAFAGAHRAANTGVTNPPEIAAYALAQFVKLGLVYGLSFTGMLNPLYVWAIESGGRSLFYMVSIGLSIVWAAVTVIAFFASRLALGGEPRGVLRGREIGLFAFAYALVTGLQLVLSAFVLNALYIALGPVRATLFGFALALVFAAIVFALFVALRQLVRGGRRG
jgi:hypothetical protein